MSVIDPRALRIATAPRYQLKLHDVKSEQIIPNGDRYVIEVIDFDESVELGQILVVTQDPKINPKDPSADPQVEQRGVIGGVIVTAGNGHLLGLPDPRVPVKVKVEGVEDCGQPVFEDRIERAAADVPMFYAPGDVVFVDRNAKGRALRIVGREVRVCNQIDILAHLKGVRLRRAADGGWETIEDV